MGNVPLFPSLRGGTQIDIDMVALDLNGIGWHTVLFIARLALAGLMVEFPAVPGAQDILVLKSAVSQRPTA
jgi:hypothetical protein